MLIELRVIVFFHAGALYYSRYSNTANKKVKQRPKFISGLTKSSALVYTIMKRYFISPRNLSFSSSWPGFDAGSDIYLLFILCLLRVGSLQQASPGRCCNARSITRILERRIEEE
jgi:hypothetical protein